MTRDANELAREHERRQAWDRPNPVRPPRTGTLVVWQSLGHMIQDLPEITMFEDVYIEFKGDGPIIAHHPTGEAEIFYPEPGMYLRFHPDREGE